MKARIEVKVSSHHMKAWMEVKIKHRVSRHHMKA
jgi:hypothetical protein